jgi:hypothetical protein
MLGNILPSLLEKLLRDEGNGLEELRVDLGIMLPDQIKQGFGRGLEEFFDQTNAGALGFHHFGSDAIGLQNLINQALHGQCLTGLQQVGFK